MTIVKGTEKGQLTLPIDLRRRLRIGKDDYLSVEAEGEVLKLRKVGARRLLGSNDPIWDFVGKAQVELRMGPPIMTATFRKKRADAGSSAN